MNAHRIRQHTSANVSSPDAYAAYVSRPNESYEYECTPHTSAYVSIRQLARCIRQHTSAGQMCRMSMNAHRPQAAYVSIRQHTYEYECTPPAGHMCRMCRMSMSAYLGTYQDPCLKRQSTIFNILHTIHYIYIYIYIYNIKYILVSHLEAGLDHVARRG